MLVRATIKGQIVIPAKLRRKYSITPQTDIQVYEEDGRIVLQPITPDYVRQVRGMLKDSALSEALREGRELDERKPKHPQR